MRKVFLILLLINSLLFGQSKDNPEKNIIIATSLGDLIKSSSDIFKTGIESILTAKGYIVVNSELNITQCNNDILCYIKIAKLSKAEGILSIETIKLDSKYLFKLTIINVSRNGIIMSYSKIYEDDINDFSKILTFTETFKNEIPVPKSYTFAVSEEIKEEIKETENTETTAEETQTEEVVTDETQEEISEGGFGMKASYGYSTLTGDDTPSDIESQGSYDAGFFILTKINDMFSIQTEFLFSKKGTEVKGEVEVYNEDYEEYDYKTIALSAYGYYTGITLSFCYTIIPNFKGYAGIYVNYLIAAGLEAVGNYKIDSTTSDISDNITKFDYGMSLGIMYKLSAFLFDLRYTRGLKTIDDSDIYDTYNTQYMFSTGIIF